MTEQYYSIAIRHREHENDRFYDRQDFVFREIKMQNGSRYWFADPFVFEKDGNTYLFYEAYDLVECKGKIAYSILQNDYLATKPKVILDKGYHLSFPFIFQSDGEIYIMPESCENDTLKLFKAVDFPNKWEECSTLFRDVFVSDSIIIEGENRERVLSCFEQYRTPPEGKLFYCWGKHHLYTMEGSKIPETLLDQGVVAEGDYGIRNAGSSFRHNGRLFRVGQNCTENQYGKGLVFFCIDSLVPYSERAIYSIDDTEMRPHIRFIGKEKQMQGVHTYNSSAHFEIIDFTYLGRFSVGNRIKRSLFIRWNRIRKKWR